MYPNLPVAAMLGDMPIASWKVLTVENERKINNEGTKSIQSK